MPKPAPVARPKPWIQRWWWRVLLAVVLVGVIGFLVYGYVSAKAELTRLTAKGSDKETKELVAQIDNYMLLPDETPTLATVNDVEKLKSQEFFKNAQNGDKVLIFSNSGRALLYRPSTKKVIEYSKVDLNTGN